ncbi:hypothetical protein MJG53_019832 [Ovis ammon polii x Ovis aries]|uniref:Uncharacterized protein n=3 Tax=Ovis TaxID=9935 RepID=A0A835ZKI4_SHEEP|nr:hypothetical protein JEQ12_020130 [Ovis aries]KAI4545271.1 hypothetical protein MG293_005537 [Ovis ammon polii]KAI4554533.1 hypothetical protein MJG53_019832 [Ovis ammon polii x Ovis aries]
MVSNKSLDLNLVNKLMGYKLAKEKMRAGAQDYKHAYHVTESIADVFKSMDAKLRSMNLEKISALKRINLILQFEAQDVQTQQMEHTISSTTTLTTPQISLEIFLRPLQND